MKVKAFLLALFLMVAMPCGIASSETLEPIETRLLLESVTGVPDGLTVHLIINDNLIAEVSGNEIISALPIYPSDQSVIKIKLAGVGKLNGAKFNFVPLIPSAPSVTKASSVTEAADETAEVTEELGEDVLADINPEDPSEAEAVEEATSEPGDTVEPITENPIEYTAEEPIEEPITENSIEESISVEENFLDGKE